MVFEFLNILKNRTSKVRSTKTSTKIELVKETCYKQKSMHDMMHEPMILSIGSINAWTKEVIMHEYFSSPTRHMCLG